MSKLILVFLIVAVSSAFSRHIHPHHDGRGRDGEWKTEVLEIDGMTVDMLQKVNSRGIVPVNNIIFFRRQEPCEEGLQRDIFGICREVWD